MGNESRFRQGVRLTLPKEHGSWSLALEPLALGMLVAPSPAGGALALAALAGFFLRRPLKMALARSSDPRRPLALATSLCLGVFALACLLFSAKLGGVGRLWPLAPAALAGLVFVWFDACNQSRAEVAEIAGTIAFGILPSAFASLKGWSTSESLALGAVMLARAVPTILFVRTYLRRKKGDAVKPGPVVVLTGIAFFLMAWLAATRMVPWPAAAFTLLMATGTVWLLGCARARFSAKTVGIAEMFLGIAMVLILAVTWTNV